MSTATAKDLTWRILTYQRFNDTPGHATKLTDRGNRTLTPRQWRRVQHKRDHAAAPFDRKSAGAR